METAVTEQDVIFTTRKFWNVVSHFDSLERIKDFELVEYRKKVKVYEKDLRYINSINQADLMDSIAKYYTRESISGHSIDQRMVPDNR